MSAHEFLPGDIDFVQYKLKNWPSQWQKPFAGGVVSRGVGPDHVSRLSFRLFTKRRELGKTTYIRCSRTL